MTKAEQPQSLIKRVNHVGILVADLGEAKRFLSDVLKLKLLRERDVPERGRSTAYFAAGNVEIELIEEHDPETKERALGGGDAIIEHVAFDVDDLEHTTALLADLGVRFQGKIVQVGTRHNAWTQPATSGGVIYQFGAERFDESEEA